MRQLLRARYYALWDVGCVWKITVMELLPGHHLEEIGQPLEVIGDIILVLIINLNAGGSVLFQSEYVTLCIREGAVLIIKAIGLGAGGQRAQTIAGAGTGLNGLVQSGAIELLFVEISYKLINRFAVCSKAGGILVGVVLIDLGIILGRTYLYLGRPHLSGLLIRDESAQRQINVILAACLDGCLAAAEKQVLIPSRFILEHQSLDKLLFVILAQRSHAHIAVLTLPGSTSIDGTCNRAVLAIVDFLHFNIELRSTGVFLGELYQLAVVHIDNGGLGGLGPGALAAAFALVDVRQNDLVRVVGQGAGSVATGFIGGVLPPPPPQAVNMEIAMAAVSRQAAAFLYSFML